MLEDSWDFCGFRIKNIKFSRCFLEENTKNPETTRYVQLRQVEDPPDDDIVDNIVDKIVDIKFFYKCIIDLTNILYVVGHNKTSLYWKS